MKFDVRWKRNCYRGCELLAVLYGWLMGYLGFKNSMVGHIFPPNRLEGRTSYSPDCWPQREMWQCAYTLACVITITLLFKESEEMDSEKRVWRSTEIFARWFGQESQGCRLSVKSSVALMEPALSANFKRKPIRFIMVCIPMLSRNTSALITHTFSRLAISTIRLSSSEPSPLRCHSSQTMTAISASDVPWVRLMRATPTIPCGPWSALCVSATSTSSRS